VTQTPDTQFRQLLSVSEVLDISTAGPGPPGPRRAWTAAAPSETRRSATGKGMGFSLAQLRDLDIRYAIPYIWSDAAC